MKKSSADKAAPPAKRIAVLFLCGFLTVMQPGQARAQQIVLDPTAAAHWVTTNAQWLADQAMRIAQYIGLTTLVTSLGQYISNSIETLERAEEIGWTFLSNTTKQHLETAEVSKTAADATVPADAMGCATSMGNNMRNGANNAIGGLVKMVVAQQVLAHHGPKAPQGAAKSGQELRDACGGGGNAFSFLDTSSGTTNMYGNGNPCAGGQ